MMLSRAAQFERETLRPQPVQHQPVASSVSMESSEPWLSVALQMLRRRLATVLSCVVTMLLLAAFYLIAVAPKYTASAVILVDPRSQRVLATEAVLPGIGQDVAAVESQVEILNSNGLARRVVDKLKLDSDPEYSSQGFLSKIYERINPEKAAWTHDNNAVKDHNKVVGNFEQKLDVRRRGLTYILEIAFTSKDAEKSALIANEIADTYIAEQVSAKRDATTDASDWLSSRIDDLRKAVQTSDQAVADFKTQNNIVDIGALGSGQTLNQRQIEDVNAKLISANARTAEATARSTQLANAAGDPKGAESLSEAMASRVLAALRVQHSTIASREAELGTQLQPNHPALAAVRSQRLEVERKMKEELTRVANNTRGELDVARNYQASLKRSLAELEEKNSKLANLRVKLQDLERESDANRNLYAQFLSRKKETGEQKDVQKSDARVISRAFAPVRPSSPGPALLFPLGALLGLGLGLGIALFKEQRDTAYRTSKALESSTGLPCLGLCPLVSEKEIASSNDDPDSELQKGLSDILLGLFTIDKDPISKILLFTSAQDGEGKTTIASGMAQLLTQFNGRTLIISSEPPSAARPIDNALRRSSRDRTARAELDAHFRHDSLMYSLSPQSSNLIADQVKFGSRLSEFLKENADQFDFILIDGASLASHRDKNMLFSAADGIIVVVEWGRTTPAQLHSALESLGADRDKIIGTALNKVDPWLMPLYDPSYKRAV